MTANSFVEIVRKGADKLRVDDILLQTSVEKIHGKGMLRIEREKIEIDMTLDAGEEPPTQTTGVFTKKDHWKLSGTIQNHLRFKCEVAPYARSKEFHTTGHDGNAESSCTLTFRPNPIELIPTKLDSLSCKERDLMFEQIQTPKGAFKTNKVPRRSYKNIPVSFNAVLFEYPFELPTWESEFSGEIEGYGFTIAKDKVNKDVQISLRSTEQCKSRGADEDWRQFYGFLHALAFIHGTHAWPYRTEYWRDGRKITDKITALSHLSKTSHSPFPETFVFSSKTGSVKWDFQDTLKKAAVFFGSDSVLSKEVACILFLFREADDGVHSEITTLALCTLFESLIRLIFKELKLEEEKRRNDVSFKLFEDAKSEVLKEIKKSVTKKPNGYSRLSNAIQSTAAFRPRDMFQAIVEHFGLQWDTDMELVFETWNEARHPLVHGRPRAGRSEDSMKQSTFNESRIAGAINILILKLIGFSGRMRVSAFEDKYRDI